MLGEALFQQEPDTSRQAISALKEILGADDPMVATATLINLHIFKFTVQLFKKHETMKKELEELRTQLISERLQYSEQSAQGEQALTDLKTRLQLLEATLLEDALLEGVPKERRKFYPVMKKAIGLH